MSWIITYTSPWWPGQQLFTQWVCPGWMDSSRALWSFQLQNRSATVLAIAECEEREGEP